jgi:hypothetical protein
VPLPLGIHPHMLRHASGVTLQYGSLVQGEREFMPSALEMLHHGSYLAMPGNIRLICSFTVRLPV